MSNIIPRWVDEMVNALVFLSFTHDTFAYGLLLKVCNFDSLLFRRILNLMFDALRSLFTNVTGSFHPLSDTGADRRRADRQRQVCARAQASATTATCTVRASGRARSLGSEGTNEQKN